jgi:hypothetical protein
MTARKSAAGAFERAVQAKRPGRTTPAPPPAPRGAAAPAEAAKPRGKSKYTLLLEPEEAVELDGVQLAVRRQLGRRVDKSMIFRALVTIVADDATVRQQLIEELRGRSE